MTPDAYPKDRPRFFAHKACRLMVKTCLAQEIGPDACYLLTIIAHTEDAKGYRGPVTFFNEQLMMVCGLASRNTLVRARQAAIGAGWLHYEPGGKARAGHYWVTIPEQFVGMDDQPTDESGDEFTCSKTDGKRRSGKHVFPAQKRTGNGTANGQDPVRQTGTILPYTYPYPKKKKKTPHTPRSGGPQSTETKPPTPEQFLDEWNAAAPFARARSMDDRLRQFRRRIGDPLWLRDYPAALERIRTAPHFRGQNRDGWVADIDWFLRIGTVNKILEGRWGNREAPSSHADRAALKDVNDRLKQRFHGNGKAVPHA
jgi:hypothetical protein